MGTQDALGGGRDEKGWPWGRDKVGTLGQGRMGKNAGGGVVEGNRVAWQHWPWGRGKVRNQKALGGVGVKSIGHGVRIR